MTLWEWLAPGKGSGHGKRHSNVVCISDDDYDNGSSDNDSENDTGVCREEYPTHVTCDYSGPNARMLQATAQ